MRKKTKRVRVKGHFRTVPRGVTRLWAYQKAKVVKRGKKQTGSSNKKRDRKRHALAPGKRMSKGGNFYYEYRRNRTDNGIWL